MIVLLSIALCAAAPPQEPEMSETPRDRYEAWLHDRGAGGEVRTGPRYGDSPFELFFVAGAPGRKLHAAAVSPTEVVVAGEPTGWGAFLRSADAPVLHAQIGWLHGAWAAHAPSKPITAAVLARDPKAQRHVTEPKVEETDGTVVFEGYYGEPPTMDPFRFRATVGPTGAATFATDPVWKLP